MGEKKQIRIAVKDKIACLIDKEQFLVCGNNDYEVVFDFDSDWEGISAKTAVFVYGNTPIHQPFVGNVCEGVEIKNATLCAIGVFAGNIKTTTGATIECRQSIRDIGGVPKPPSKEVYDEIMALLDKAIEAHTELPVGGKKGQVLKKVSDKDYDTEWANDEQRDLTEIEESLANKLDKTTEANKIYGTDAKGEQTLYPTENFAQKDSVVYKITTPSTIYGVDKNGNQMFHYISSLVLQNVTVKRDENKDILVLDEPVSENGATSKKFVDKKKLEAIAHADSRINTLEERVSDLEYLTLDYPSDTTTAYEKTVPADVGSKALIKSIGGASVFSNNLLDPAKLTSDNTNITVNNDGSITFVVGAGDGVGIALPSLPIGTYYLTVEQDSPCIINTFINYRSESLYPFEITSSDDWVRVDFENMDWNGDGTLGVEDITVTAKFMLSTEEGLPFEPYFPPKNTEVERVESIGANIIPFPYNYKGKVMDVGYTETINGVTFEVLENGLISARGTATSKAIFNFWQTIMPAGEYYISGKHASGGSVLGTYNYNAPNYNMPQNGVGTINQKFIHVGGAFGARVSIDSGVTVNSVFSPIITKDVYVSEFKPYSAEPIDTLEIPEAVRNLDGYGREGSYIEWKDGKATFTVTKDENLEILTEPVVKDITSYFDKNKLSIQRGGLLRFANKDNLPVPSHIVYVKRKG